MTVIHDRPSPAHLILVAEDDRDVRDCIEFMLRCQGFDVQTSCDGRELLERLDQCQPSAIVLDIMMPNMDGYELTRALRAMPEYTEVPIVMVTSMGERIDRVRGFDAGVDEYITKPHDRTQLLEVVRKLLGHTAREETPG